MNKFNKSSLKLYNIFDSLYVKIREFISKIDSNDEYSSKDSKFEFQTEEFRKFANTEVFTL